MRKTRRKQCDDTNGWVVIFRWPIPSRPIRIVLGTGEDALFRVGYPPMDVRWYKTFAGAEKAARDHRALCAMQTRMSGGKAMVIAVSELERWHDSTGIDELERMYML